METRLNEKLFTEESLPGESICLRLQKRRAAPRFGHNDVVFVYFWQRTSERTDCQSSAKMLF